MPYIDGFVVPVPTTKREEYRAHEAKWWPTFRDMGAIAFGVGWGDDVPHGKQTDFFRAVSATEDETVALCWMVWPDKATRDAAYKKMMDLDPDMSGMPFDGKRMIYGGFEPLLMEGAAA